jgi:hypothetical protein
MCHVTYVLGSNSLLYNMLCFKPRKPVNRNSIFWSISIYCNRLYTTTECDEQTVALYWGLTVYERLPACHKFCQSIEISDLLYALCIKQNVLYVLLCNRADMAWTEQAETCRLFVCGHDAVVTSCVN